jgi:hypothetical protein
MKHEYRRGVELGVWQRLWHFNEMCPSFPTRSFAIRKETPSDDELCARCCSTRALALADCDMPEDSRK